MTTRISRKVATPVCAALALTALVAIDASAQNPYTIDGIVPASGVAPGPTQTTDPFGSVQELGPKNGSNTKVGVIHSAVPPMLDFTNPNGQTDLRNIWMQTTKATNGDVWLYFAWERDANTGSGFIAYEFQQNALSPSCVYTGSGIDLVLPQSPAETALINSCNPWANRQPGDFLILWDQSGNALTIIKRVFTLVGGQLVLGPSQTLGTAVAAISADGFRGEAAINLTTDVFPSNTCVSFANIIPGTVTGNSDTADYKDTVLAAFAPISNCGVVTVTKRTQPAGQTGTFPYTLARADGSAIRFDGTLQINQTLTHDGDSTGSPIQNLIVGDNYTLTEAAQTSPWQLVSIVCTTGSHDPVDITAGGTFSVEASATTACVITNRLLRGSIRVIKHVVNDNGGTAVATDFTISLGDDPSTPTTFSGHESPGDTFSFDAGQTYSVTEIGLPSGYTLVSMVGDCAGTIEADVTKVCTITNDDQPAAPTGVTVQRAVLHDRLTITGIRVGAPGTPATVSFTLYSDSACSVLVGSEGPVTISYSGTTGTASTVVGVNVAASATTVYYWRAQYSGDQFNTGFTTPCGAERTTAIFQP